MQCSFLKVKSCLSVCVRAKQSECAEVASHTCDIGWRAPDDDVAQQACIVAGDGDGSL
jgi:hypothetical protein